MRWIESVGGAEGLLLVDFSLPQYWLSGAPSLTLTAIYYKNDEGTVLVSVTDQVLAPADLTAAQQFAAWAEEHSFARVALGQALSLTRTCIPKPWGQEIWLTGVEQRGVCRVEGMGGETPIPWMQAAMPGEGIGVCGQPLILLKILDPLAEPVLGDLYFELHEEKREVYVVTHIDELAWPGGAGYIRFGFSPDKRALFHDADSFRSAYLEIVRDYEAVRRVLDAHSAAGGASDQTDATEDVTELVERERKLRNEMDSFTHMKPLRVGDVVKVPLLTPHALQHGVRTIEFQTPVYERKILSFAQKVLTQGHWDTAEAVAQMVLEPSTPTPFEVLCHEEGQMVERIVDFSDFEVRRVSLACGRSLENLSIEQYALVMVVEGQLAVAGTLYGPEEALILPRGWQESLLAVQPASTLVFLLALPRDTAVES